VESEIIIEEDSKIDFSGLQTPNEEKIKQYKLSATCSEIMFHP
jgi:hypothetical protein